MGGRGESSWTDEEVVGLRAHHAKGVSASIIGNDMGRTRNSVLGKLWRLKLSNAGSTIRKVVGKPPKKTTAGERARQQKYTQKKTIERQKAEIEELRRAPVTPLAVEFSDLGHNACRYPEGDGPFTFCGHLQQPGYSYCHAHAALTHRNYHRMTPDEYQEHRLQIVVKARKLKCTAVDPSEAAA